MEKTDNTTNMEVMIEIGHKAWKTIKPTIEGHTHEWTVFLQGVNGREIEHIIEKVMFHLPDNYQDSKQIREKPPYVVSESTSVSISIQIDVFFCPEANLGKVNYLYDLYISDKAVDSVLMRKLTFSNPSEEFKEKLLLAGGEPVGMQETLPVMMGGLLNCQAEPDNEIIILNEMSDMTLLKDLITVAKRMLSIEDLKSCLLYFDNAVLCNCPDEIEFKERMNLFTAAILNRNYKLIEDLISSTGSRQIISIILNKCPFAFSSIATTLAQVTKMMKNGTAVLIYQCDDAEETVLSTMSHLETELSIWAPTRFTSDFASQELQHLDFKIVEETTIPCYTSLTSFCENNNFDSKYGHLFPCHRNWDKMYVFLRRSLGCHQNDIVFQCNYKIMCIQN